MNITFTATASSFQTLLVSAPHADVSVRADDVTEAVIEITGPEDIVRQADAVVAAGIWTLNLPDAPASTFSTSGGNMTVSTNRGMVIQAGRVSGGVFFNGVGDVTIVNGNVRVAQVEPVTVAIRIPRGTRLITRMQSGDLSTAGELGSVDHTGSSGQVRIAHTSDIIAETASGDVSVRQVETVATIRTASGDVRVDGGTRVDVQAASGDIYFAATADCVLSARTASGDIRIRRFGHQVIANTRTASGDVRDS